MIRKSRFFLNPISILALVAISIFFIYFVTSLRSVNTDDRSRATGTSCQVRQGCSTDHPGYGYRYTPVFPDCKFGPPWPTWPSDYSLTPFCRVSATSTPATTCQVHRGCSADHPGYMYSYTPTDPPTCSYGPPWAYWPNDYSLSTQCGGGSATPTGSMGQSCPANYHSTGACEADVAIQRTIGNCCALGAPSPTSATGITPTVSPVLIPMYFYNTVTKSCTQAAQSYASVTECESNLAVYNSTISSGVCYISLYNCRQAEADFMYFYNTQTNLCTRTTEKYDTLAACTSNVASYNSAISTGVCYGSETSCQAATSCQRSDLNCDKVIDIFDYNILVENFGKTGAAGFIKADIDKNGVVDIFDYNILVTDFGSTAASASSGQTTGGANTHNRGGGSQGTSTGFPSTLIPSGDGCSRSATGSGGTYIETCCTSSAGARSCRSIPH